MTNDERYFTLLSERGYWWATDLSDRLLVMGIGPEVQGDGIRESLSEALREAAADQPDLAECQFCEEFNLRDDMVDLAPEHLPAHLLCGECHGR